MLLEQCLVSLRKHFNKYCNSWTFPKTDELNRDQDTITKQPQDINYLVTINIKLQQNLITRGKNSSFFLCQKAQILEQHSASNKNSKITFSLLFTLATDISQPIPKYQLFTFDNGQTPSTLGLHPNNTVFSLYCFFCLVLTQTVSSLVHKNALHSYCLHQHDWETFKSCK